MSCPTLKTDRLTLRGHSVADFDSSLALWSDPEVVRFIGGKTATAEEVWARLLRYSGHWALLGFGFWTIQETATGAFVGEAGLADFRRAIAPPLGPDPEAGWVLIPRAHGRGYAREAMIAILDWADATLGARRTTCIIDPSNAASLKLAAKLGYQPFGRGLYRGDEVVMLERRWHGGAAEG
jgi:RimJ/RimL family protein N-acetyltransferase